MKQLIFIFACIAFLGCKKEDCYIFNITATTVKNGVTVSSNTQTQIICDITRKDARQRSNQMNYTVKTISGSTVNEVRFECTFKKE